MLLWTLAAALGIVGFSSLLEKFVRSVSDLVSSPDSAALREAAAVLHELQETIEAGLVPAPERWNRLLRLKPPWGTLAYETLTELRRAGGALLPSLTRIRALVEENRDALAQGRAKAAQAVFQACAGVAMAPLFGAAMYALLPALWGRPLEWAAACAAALAWSGIAGTWIAGMVDDARWGGLKPHQRPWLATAQCAGERFLALVRGGTPADLAWVRAYELITRECPDLAARWGASVWRPDGDSGAAAPRPHARNAATSLIDGGLALRKAIQVSLMEGRPCLDRAESELRAMRSEARQAVEKELALLPVRTLRPLFLCVAPALLGLLVAGMVLNLPPELMSELAANSGVEP